MKLLKSLCHWHTERLSMTALYLIVALSMVVFLLFWFVGYDRPSLDYPDFNEPLFIDLLLLTIGLLFLVAVGFVAWSIWRAVKVRGKAQRVQNNIPVKKISYSVLIGTAVLLLFTFLVGSSAPMSINGTPYTDRLWLKTSDMFILTSVVMMLLAVGALIAGAIRNSNDRSQRHKKEGKA